MTNRRPLRRLQPATLPAKHLTGTDGARDVETDMVAEAVTLVGEAILEAGLAVLVGEPGLSKTFTSVFVAERLAIPAHYIEQRPGVRGKSIELDLLTALGVEHDPRDHRRDLQDALVDACSIRRAVIIDEADRLGAEGVDVLRYVWTQPGNATAFIFVGFRVELLLAANPALDSRADRRARFRPLRLDETIPALRAYHPTFERAPESLLVRVHGMTGGKFRVIAQLLKQILLEAGEPQPKLTRELLERAWHHLGREAA